MRELDSIVERVNGFNRRSTWYPAVSDALGQEIDGMTGKGDSCQKTGYKTNYSI